jgi:phospholipid/cholesterol/gamma-HCH transport system ATP-binding protein
MIRVENLWKSFGPQEVLRGASFEVRQGEFMALIGGSGCGKSLLLKLVVGLLKPDRGGVWIAGKDMSALNRRELESLRSRIGFVFQGGALFDSMTVYDNVAFPLREKTSLGEGVIRRKVMGELELVGLREAEQKFPAQLSGGMLKRVALARALVRDPEIVLFDEPTTGLDPVASRAVLELFGAVHQRLNLTGVLVSHEIPRIFEIVQKVAMLHEGRVVAVEPPRRFCASPNPIIQEFVNGETREFLMERNRFNAASKKARV